MQPSPGLAPRCSPGPALRCSPKPAQRCAWGPHGPLFCSIFCGLPLQPSAALRHSSL
jgi:hypothetical protein